MIEWILKLADRGRQQAGPRFASTGAAMLMEND